MKYALLGNKLGHSKSKLIHEFLYKKLNYSDTYDLIEVDKSNLNEYIEMLKNGKYQGFNITIPYKTEILKYVDEMSFEVKKINACNTIIYEDNKIKAYNTDYFGFRESIKKYDLTNKLCYIMGNGGASKAVIEVLLDLNANVVSICRNKNNKSKVEEIFFEEANNIKGYMLINATPLGMYPNINDELLVSKKTINNFDIVYDLIYNPEKTNFLKSSNNITINGIDMLIFQAIYAFSIWKKIDVNDIIKYKDCIKEVF